MVVIVVVLVVVNVHSFCLTFCLFGMNGDDEFVVLYFSFYLEIFFFVVVGLVLMDSLFCLGCTKSMVLG